jgi:hypothetical protein
LGFARVLTHPVEFNRDDKLLGIELEFGSELESGVFETEVLGLGVDDTDFAGVLLT